MVGQETSWGHVLMEQGSARALRVGWEAGRSLRLAPPLTSRMHITLLNFSLLCFLIWKSGFKGLRGIRSVVFNEVMLATRA